MNKLFWFGFIFLGIFFIGYGSIFGQTVPSSVATLEIPETVIIPGPKITLLELGALQGGTEETINAIKKVTLGTAPNPGQVRTLSKDYLSFIVQQYKFPQLLELRMAEKVVIKTKAFCVRDQEIQKAITDLFIPKPNIIKKWAELRNLPKEIWLSQPDWKIEAYPLGKIPEVGTALFKVVISCNQEKKVLNISGKIRATALLYKANRNISALSEVKKSDFEVIETELVNGKEMVGEFPFHNRSTRLIKQNEILLQDQIQPIPQVAKDHSVTVLVKNEAIEITMVGIAKKDGWLGDHIEILNPTSNKIFRGKVIDSSMVEVHF